MVGLQGVDTSNSTRAPARAWPPLRSGGKRRYKSMKSFALHHGQIVQVAAALDRR